MREPTFLILAAMASGPMYGHQLIPAVEELSNGRVRLGAGTIYAALERLTGDRQLAIENRVVDGQIRRYYTLTEDGRDELITQIHRVEANAAMARRQMGIVATS